MSRILTTIFILFFLFTNQLIAQENIMILKLKDGDVKIELFEDVAPNHVKRIKELADSGQYENVVFHRVIDGFMAQTGDVNLVIRIQEILIYEELEWVDQIYQI